MNILYVYAHPQPSSFNAKIKNDAVDFLSKKSTLHISDLYKDNFNAVASWGDFSHEAQTQYFAAQYEAFKNRRLVKDIQAELKKVNQADHFIFQFPLWWFSVPAILKGWFDRIFIKGFAYDSGKIFKEGLLRGKTASLILTTQSPKSAYQVSGVHGATIDVFLQHIHHTLRFVGIQTLEPFVIYGAFNLDKEHQTTILQNYHLYLEKLVHLTLPVYNL